MNFADRVKDTTTTTGTGTVTLSNSAAPGFRTFVSAFSIGTAQIPYCIVSGAEWETGIGALVTSDTLSRDSVLASSNGGALVNFSEGSKDVFCTLAASQIASFLTVDDVAFSQTIPLNTGGTRYMPQTTISGALTFAPASSPVRGSLVYLRLVADGTNAPNFGAFKEWGGSLGWDNTTGIINQVQFFYDGTDSFYSVSQEIGAVPQVDATGITLSGPTSGVVSTASSNFTVGVSPSGGTLAQEPTVVTPSDGGSGGEFTPAAISLTNASKSGTFTYTPASTGSKTISIANDAGLSNPASITYTSNDAATVPGAPTIGAATAGNASASVTFTPPASDGGSTITSYTVTSSPGGLTSTGTASPINVAGLTNGTAYTFTVTATNGIGTGPASASSNSITPANITYDRMGTLVSTSESGTGPYTYTGTGGTGYNASAIAIKKMQTGVDGYMDVKITNRTGGFIFGLITGTSAVAYPSLTYGMYATASHTDWRVVSAGTVVNATTVLTAAVGDIARIKRVGSTLTAEISKDNGETFTVIRTWTGVPSTAYGFEVLLSDPQAYSPNGSSGLA